MYITSFYQSSHDLFGTGRKWTEEYNTPEMRAKHSQFYTLMENARLANHTTFFKFTRLYPEQFEYVVQKVGHLISHRDTNYRDAITVGKCIVGSMFLQVATRIDLAFCLLVSQVKEFPSPCGFWLQVNHVSRFPLLFEWGSRQCTA